VSALNYKELTSKHVGEKSEQIRERVKNARVTQLNRFAGDKIFCNAKMTTSLLKKHCKINCDSEKLLELAINKLGLSARAYDRIVISTIHGLNP